MSINLQSLAMLHASRATLLHTVLGSGKAHGDTHIMVGRSRVGTGCTDAERRDIYERLKPYLVTKKPANVSSTGHSKVTSTRLGGPIAGSFCVLSLERKRPETITEGNG